jgi:hypothetical protein
MDHFTNFHKLDFTRAGVSAWGLIILKKIKTNSEFRFVENFTSQNQEH